MFFLLACTPPEEAPRDFETVMHDLWAHYADRDTEALAVDVADLTGLVDLDTLPSDGLLADLGADEAAAAGAPDVDPEPAVGLLTIGTVDCTPSEMERVLAHLDQMELYPGNYTAYDRAYTSSFESFDAGEADHLSWDATYGAQVPLTGSWVSNIRGGMHRVPGAEAPTFLSRTVMEQPAVTTPEAVVFDVDFQLEIFYPHDSGVVHVFAMWRHLVTGTGLSLEDAGVQALVLGGLHDWDDATTDICAEGRI